MTTSPGYRGAMIIMALVAGSAASYGVISLAAPASDVATAPAVISFRVPTSCRSSAAGVPSSRCRSRSVGARGLAGEGLGEQCRARSCPAAAYS